MILPDCLSGHFGGHHYAQQTKPTGQRIPQRLPEDGIRGAEQHQRTSQRLCSVAGCARQALPYTKKCIKCDRGLR